MQQREKVRLYILARELNINTTDLLRLCKQLGYQVLNQLSNLDSDQQEKLTEVVKRGFNSTAMSLPVTPLPADVVTKVQAWEQRDVPTIVTYSVEDEEESLNRTPAQQAHQQNQKQQKKDKVIPSREQSTPLAAPATVEPIVSGGGQAGTASSRGSLQPSVPKHIDPPQPTAPGSIQDREVVRVYILAQKLNIDTTDLLRLCKQANYNVTNQFSPLDPDQQRRLEEMVKKSSKSTVMPTPAEPVPKVVPTLSPRPIKRRAELQDTQSAPLVASVSKEQTAPKPAVAKQQTATEKSATHLQDKVPNLTSESPAFAPAKPVTKVILPEDRKVPTLSPRPAKQEIEPPQTIVPITPPPFEPSAVNPAEPRVIAEAQTATEKSAAAQMSHTGSTPTPESLPFMLKIFISYRRDDSEIFAGRIYDRLVLHLGREYVFMDVDAIPFGVDFRQHLTDAVEACDVLLALIGERWLTMSQNGQRRLDDPKDFVRIEIEAALNRGIAVIPVLLGRASMPREDELPAVLASLVYRNAAHVAAGRDFHAHMDRLIRGIEHLAKRAKPKP